MGFNYVISKNEEERFEQVKENYDYNLPKQILNIDSIKVLCGIPEEIYPKRRLDYGSLAMTVEMKEVLRIVGEAIENSKKKYEGEENQFIKKWIESAEKTYEKMKEIEDEKVMIVAYEF